MTEPTNNPPKPGSRKTLGALIGLGIVVLVVWVSVALLGRNLYGVKVSWSGTELSAFTYRDRPVVITHLFAEVPADRAPITSWAELTPPILIPYGGSVKLPPVSKLIWKDSTGTEVEPPKPGMKVGALSYVPDVSQ